MNFECYAIVYVEKQMSKPLLTKIVFSTNNNDMYWIFGQSKTYATHIDRNMQKTSVNIIIITYKYIISLFCSHKFYLYHIISIE